MGRRGRGGKNWPLPTRHLRPPYRQPMAGSCARTMASDMWEWASCRAAELPSGLPGTSSVNDMRPTAAQALALRLDAGPVAASCLSELQDSGASEVAKGLYRSDWAKAIGATWALPMSARHTAREGEMRAPYSGRTPQGVVRWRGWMAGSGRGGGGGWMGPPPCLGIARAVRGAFAAIPCAVFGQAHDLLDSACAAGIFCLDRLRILRPAPHALSGAPPLRDWPSWVHERDPGGGGGMGEWEWMK